MLTTSAGIVTRRRVPPQRFSNGVVVNDGSIEAGSGSEPRPRAASPSAPALCAAISSARRVRSLRRCATGYDIQRESDQGPTCWRYHFPHAGRLSVEQPPCRGFRAEQLRQHHRVRLQSLNPAFGNSVEPMALPQASYEWTSDPTRSAGAGTRARAAQSCPSDRARGRRLSSRRDGGCRSTAPGATLLRFRREPAHRRLFRRPRGAHAQLRAGDDRLGQTLELPSNIGTTATVAGRVFRKQC